MCEPTVSRAYEPQGGRVNHPTVGRMYQARFARSDINSAPLVACVNQLLVGHMNHRGGGGNHPTVGRMYQARFARCGINSASLVACTRRVVLARCWCCAGLGERTQSGPGREDKMWAGGEDTEWNGGGGHRVDWRGARSGGI